MLGGNNIEICIHRKILKNIANEVGREVNINKTKHMFTVETVKMELRNNVINNNAFKAVEKFKYFDAITTTDNTLQSEIDGK